ncbi:hypothetical protein GALL_297490 [mine drainage metagenome]|uniref:Uncharacterized protein n=1 Tax=mine drainage metagenome TaxID=410659 RepID=A0A1J5R8I7_9ZZZZ
MSVPTNPEAGTYWMGQFEALDSTVAVPCDGAETICTSLTPFGSVSLLRTGICTFWLPTWTVPVSGAATGGSVATIGEDVGTGVDPTRWKWSDSSVGIFSPVAVTA